ncbi:hypothetical protein [Streptomyces sp. NPDC020742]|uniref:hypothetical protein n=1 Tax=unclassified Streptomyces TaxID=2593676 RepID=UPI0033C6597F
MENLGHAWPWYALALVGVYRLTATGLDALVRRVVRTVSQACAEDHHAATAARTTAVPLLHGTVLQGRPRHGTSPDAAVPSSPVSPTTGHGREGAW